jgi:hypothetical protein
VEGGTPKGIDLAAAVLAELGIDQDAIGLWRLRQQQRARAGADDAIAAAA